MATRMTDAQAAAVGQMAVQARLGRAGGAMNSELLELLRSELEALDEIMIDFRRRRDQIAADPGFTPIGKQHQTAELGHQTAHRVRSRVAERLETWKQAKAAAEDKLRLQPAATEDPTISFLRESEVRRILYDMDKLEVMQAYREATRSGEDELLEAAVENAPRIRPLVSDAALLEGKRTRAERVNPDAAARVAELEEALAILTEAVESALVDAGNFPEDEVRRRREQDDEERDPAGGA